MADATSNQLREQATNEEVVFTSFCKGMALSTTKFSFLS